MNNFTKKDKIILICYAAISILFFVMYFSLHNKFVPNVISESEIKHINQMKEEEEKVKYYLSITPGEYFDTLSRNATLKVEFIKGIYIFEIRTQNGAQDNFLYRFSGRYDKKINGIHYNDLICEKLTYEDGGTINETKKIREKGEGTITTDGSMIYWDDAKEEKKYDSNYNAIFEMPNAVKGD